MREHFILHWQSVRPVPVITIDFGDGRMIRRTITGNSIHYVLTPEGTVVDAVPGLYGPKAFLRVLREAEKQIPLVTQAGDAKRWHAEQAIRIGFEFDQDYLKSQPAEPLNMDVTRLGFAPPTNYVTSPQIPFSFSAKPAAPAVPSAMQAAVAAVSKSLVEFPLVQAFQPNSPLLFTEPPAAPSNDTSAEPLLSPMELTDAQWQRIAAVHPEDAALDNASFMLMEMKTIGAQAAARITLSKLLVENPMMKMLGNFERSVAQDTVRNEYLLHLQIHYWLADAKTAGLANDVNALNKKIYAELFLTPDSDPWLGLVPNDTYTALQNGGVCGQK